MLSLLFSHIWLLSRDEVLKPKRFSSKTIPSQGKKEVQRIHFKHLKTQIKAVNTQTEAEQWAPHELEELKTRLATATRSSQQRPT